MKGKIIGEMALRLALEEISFQANSLFMAKDRSASLRDEKNAKAGEILLNGLTQLRGSGLKILQNLALEEGLLPEPLVQKIEAAFDQVEPLSGMVVRKLIKVEFARPLEEIFDDFNDKAFAAASLGQVHEGRLKTGEEVVIKVQYPHIARDIQQEIGLLRTVAAQLKNDLIRRTINEISMQILWEVDYLREAENTEHFGEFWAQKNILIPRVIKNASTERVLTQTRVPGATLIDLERRGAPIPAGAFRKIFEFFFQSLFELKGVHFDPHPGNFMVTTDGSLAVVDFGAVKLDIPESEVNLMRELTKKDLDSSKVLEGYRTLGAQISNEEEASFLATVVYPYHKCLMEILHHQDCDFSQKRDAIKGLRRSLIEQSSNPALRLFSPELSTVHKASLSLFQMFSRLGAQISTQL